MISQYERIESFRKHGFVIIPDILTPDEVKELRALMREVTQQMPSHKRMVTIGEILSNEKLLAALLRIQFDQKLLSTLSKIVAGSLTYVNNIQIQCNMFGVGVNSGWHLDSGTEANLLTNSYMYAPDYYFGKVGIYLQDNNSEFGGGINVIPGSQKAFGYCKANLALQLAHRFIRNKGYALRAKRFGRDLLVPTKAGSAIYFDSRLMHHSTAPGALSLTEADKNQTRRVGNDVISADQAKYALYWDACSPKNAEKFLENASVRAISEEFGLSRQRDREIYFTEYLSYHYPNDYPAEYVNCVEQAKTVTIASVDKGNADLWKVIRDS